ncbi:hypothetical protein LVY74_05270 [Acinetobacter sp. ME22]|uniref:hypothetical protein n=1 Tax=Acinetobacter sp. ME22 TaxID=2904802 RepID=UPI001EDC327D|nr:hypothetical protein [Acinetobacter sp. ME22]MCG2572969.1 hypothetical protein [Acinetobacter sp. ME22]
MMLKLALIALVVISLAGLIFLILQSKKMLNDVVKEHKQASKPQPTKKIMPSKKKR